MNSAVQHSTNHFKGVAVVIDDEIDKEQGIVAIVDAIQAGGGHAVKLADLPSEEADLEHFAGVAFFIMDWHLAGAQGVKLPENVAQSERERKLKFLDRLRKQRHAPVFIFTNEDIDEVRGELHALGDDGAHILVRTKGHVAGRVYEELNQWAEDFPSVLALKSWERRNRQAINGLFNELHDRHRFWPVILWEAFTRDSVPANREIGHLVSRLVAARTEAPELDLGGFVPRLSAELSRDETAYKQALLGVLESERFIRNSFLDPDSFSTGDVFLNEGDNGNKTYWLNIRAECDCISRGAGTPTMYLLKGQPIGHDKLTFIRGADAVAEKDNEAIVYAMYDGNHVRFRFLEEIKIKEWSGNKGWKDKRIGRLLPPFLTRLLERYAAYSHRPGLPRVPWVLIPMEAAGDSEDSADQPACEVPMSE